MTICVECKYHKERVGPDSEYMHHCMVNPHKEWTDPVTGQNHYVIQGDAMPQIITEEKYRACRDINHGNCTNFVAK